MSVEFYCPFFNRVVCLSDIELYELFVCVGDESLISYLMNGHCLSLSGYWVKHQTGVSHSGHPVTDAPSESNQEGEPGLPVWCPSTFIPTAATQLQHTALLVCGPRFHPLHPHVLGTRCWMRPSENDNKSKSWRDLKTRKTQTSQQCSPVFPNRNSESLSPQMHCFDDQGDDSAGIVL